MILQSSAVKPAALSAAFNLVEEINHRVVNEYSEAIASLSLASSRAGDDRIKTELARAAGRLHDHAEAHRALMPPRIASSENLADYVGRICNSFSQATLAERGVMLILETADIPLPADRCWRIGLIIAELIRNAARHGRFEGEARISVHIAELCGEVRCLVRDTGRPSANAVPGRGQQLIRSLADDLGGGVDWSFTAEGCLALVRVPAFPAKNLSEAGLRASELVIAGDMP